MNDTLRYLSGAFGVKSSHQPQLANAEQEYLRVREPLMTRFMTAMPLKLNDPL